MIFVAICVLATCVWRYSGRNRFLDRVELVERVLAATSSIIYEVAADDIEEVAFGSMIHMISYILTHDIMAPYT